MQRYHIYAFCESRRSLTHIDLFIFAQVIYSSTTSQTSASDVLHFLIHQQLLNLSDINGMVFSLAHPQVLISISVV